MPGMHARSKRTLEHRVCVAQKHGLLCEGFRSEKVGLDTVYFRGLVPGLRWGGGGREWFEDAVVGEDM